MSKNNATQTVIDIGNINFKGNIIPINWYNSIKLQNGRTDLLAINILSELVFLYRPTVVRDESTGCIKSVNKKFKSDLLQKSYGQLSELFGVSKKLITEAIIRLENLGILRRVFRTIEVYDGMRMSNVLFIEMFPEALENITKLAAVPLQGDSHNPTEGTALAPQGETNTENTTENTTSNKNYNKKIFEEDFKRFWDVYPKRVAKEAAKKAFDKAIKKTDIETIIKSLKLYTEKQDANFYANPATWLNGGQWMDEYKENKPDTIKLSDFKKRYGIDKLICDKIVKFMGGAYFKSLLEDNNSKFTEDEMGKLKLSISTKFACEKVLDDCTSILHNLGYNFVDREIIGLKHS